MDITPEVQMKLEKRVVLTQEQRDEAIDHAVQLLSSNKIKFILESYDTAKFKCYRKSDNKEFIYYAGTGKILGVKGYPGLSMLVRILCR